MDAVASMAEDLKLLSDKTRLTIVVYLRERSLCVCEIVDLLQTSQPNASQHLRKLKEAGFVIETRKGQWIYYQLNLSSKPHLLTLLQHIPRLHMRTLQFIQQCE